MSALALVTAPALVAAAILGRLLVGGHRTSLAPPEAPFAASRGRHLAAERPRVLRPRRMRRNVDAADGAGMLRGTARANGLWKIDGRRLKVRGFLATGRGVHGLYPSRDARYLYATNRGEGSVSVISFLTGRAVAKWWIPGGGSPDMDGVSADGKVLWLSGRYNVVVYAISIRNGRLLARIPVGAGPHGLCVWPQPGRHPLGHTGVLR